MATHPSIPAWKIPWTEESAGLQSMGSQRVGCDWTHTYSTIVTVWIHSHTKTPCSQILPGPSQLCFLLQCSLCLQILQPASIKFSSILQDQVSMVSSCEALPTANLDTCTHTNMSQTALSSPTHSPFVHRWTITYIILRNHCWFICFPNEGWGRNGVISY